MLPEGGLRPAEDLAQVGGSEGGFDADLLKQTVLIKLNGGLGTSMGLQKAKSLLPVKDGATFLDIIVKQILALREGAGAQVTEVKRPVSLPRVFHNPQLSLRRVPGKDQKDLFTRLLFG